jgi:glucose-6-phosphate isomerase, archaeal
MSLPSFPFSTDLLHAEQILLAQYDQHITRRLSAMRGQYLDGAAYEALLSQEDKLLYEVYEVSRPGVNGELSCGLSIVHPGQVGDEYFMTKGHYHAILGTAEVYLCLRGKGYMVMETPEGQWAIEPLYPHRLLYVPPRWAHRTINTSPESDVVTFYVYPADAGHDYGSIERQGFRKLVLEIDGKPVIVDNPRWTPPQGR